MIISGLLLWLATFAHANLDSDVRHPSLVGHWQFYKKIYQGQEMPEGPSATLRLHFDFDKDGVSHLYWWHVGEGDHCYREGRYRLTGNILSEEVTWVSPANTYGCSDDPDMKLGRKTNSPVRFVGNEFVTTFHLGDEPLDLVWKKLDVEE
jgi:hypothetical protein